MKKVLFAFVLLLGILALASFTPSKKTPRVLVFYKTNGFYHTSIPAGLKGISTLCAANGIACDSTADSLQFNKANLKKYSAVIFLNTTGNILGNDQQKALKEFIGSGKGFVGIHAAADTEYEWNWYNGLVGAYFKSHPAQQQASLVVNDKTFDKNSQLPAVWSKWDEWYNFKSTFWDDVNVIVTLDEKSIKGGENGDHHPVSWYREYDGGRSFYTGMGHTDETYADPLFLSHLLAGIQYAIGRK